MRQSISTSDSSAVKTKPLVDTDARRPRARFALGSRALELTYRSPIYEQILRHVDLIGDPVTGDEVMANPALLAGAEVIMSGWGIPRLDERLLAQATDLRAVFYGAGTVRGWMTEAAWDAGIVVTTAASANAVPVAEFTVSQIYMCLKNIWRQAFTLREEHQWRRIDPGAGGYRSRVGLVSLGEIGRRVVEKLADSDLEVLAYDIRPDYDFARRVGFEFVSLEEIYSTCDVISLHTPLLPETRNMIDEPLLRSMRQGASLINTARGGIIHQPALEQVLADRPDLLAVLDVTCPEPPPPECALWRLDNVVLLPHIAGSTGAECARMGWLMLDELQRYVRGEPLQGRLAREQVAFTA